MTIFVIYEWIDGKLTIVDMDGIKGYYSDEKTALLDFDSCKILRPNGQFLLARGIGVTRKLIEAKI